MEASNSGAGQGIPLKSSRIPKRLSTEAKLLNIKAEIIKSKNAAMIPGNLRLKN